MERIAKKLEKKSLSGQDLLNLVSGRANLMTYSDLMKYNDIDKAMAPHGALILLFESRSGYGHWTAVIRQSKKVIEAFDSYGIKPDEELKWTKNYLRKKHGKAFPHLTWLLLNSKYPKISYNHYPFQRYMKNVNTCGRWTALRIIFKKLPLEEFIKMFAGDKLDPDQLVTMLTMFL